MNKSKLIIYKTQNQFRLMKEKEKSKFHKVFYCQNLIHQVWMKGEKIILVLHTQNN